MSDTQKESENIHIDSKSVLQILNGLESLRQKHLASDSDASLSENFLCNMEKWDESFHVCS